MYINFNTDSFLAAHFMARNHNHKILLRDLVKMESEESDTLRKSYYRSVLYYLTFPNQRNGMLKTAKSKLDEEI
jgi:hypothetical protein